jgi:hypothetical protein
VKADTIRQHHEPRAIRALADIVLNDEIQARSKSPDGERVTSAAAAWPETC